MAASPAALAVFAAGLVFIVLNSSVPFTTASKSTSSDSAGWPFMVRVRVRVGPTKLRRELDRVENVLGLILARDTAGSHNSSNENFLAVVLGV